MVWSRLCNLLCWRAQCLQFRRCRPKSPVVANRVARTQGAVKQSVATKSVISARKLTSAKSVLPVLNWSSATAFDEIDRVLEMAYRYKRPVYVDPRHGQRRAPYTSLPSHTSLTDERALREACNEITAQSRDESDCGGVEIHRFGLQDDLIHFAEKNNIPMASTGRV